MALYDMIPYDDLSSSQQAEVNMDKSLKGSCMCGAVSFEVDGEPSWVANCHCEDCRHSTGAPMSTFVGCDIGKVTFGGEKGQVYASSEGVKRTFCPKCGTPISYESMAYKDEIHFYVGLFEHPEELKPSGHVFTSEMMPWLKLADYLPSRE
jgi:hypothetical protein